nr:MAG TPA: hypothetical protein [Caudoviricetes sp.]
MQILNARYLKMIFVRFCTGLFYLEAKTYGKRSKETH